MLLALSFPPSPHYRYYSSAPKLRSYNIYAFIHTSLSLCSAMIASWNMAGTGRQDFLKERIPSSQHFDIDVVADPSSPYPHMLPSEQGFEEHAGRV